MRQHFTDEEWSTLMQAPTQAIAAITLADKVDPVSFLHELQAAIQILAEELQRQDLPPGMTQAFVSGLQTLDAEDALSGDQLLLKKEFELLGHLQSFKNAREGIDSAIDHFRKTAAVLEAKVVAAEVNACKEWLMSFATKVAQVAREGGLMGFGSSRISEREADVLKKLAEALGVMV